MEWFKTSIPLWLLIAAGIGYFLRRFIERKHVDEGLDRSLKALSLKKALDEAGMELNELDQFTTEVLQRVGRVRSREDAVTIQLGRHDLLAPVTQLEMNEAQRHRAEQAALVLERVSIEFADELERDEAARFAKAMEAWETLVENHAELAQLLYRDGSMAPMAYWAERERMTTTRVAELQELIAERRELR